MKSNRIYKKISLKTLLAVLVQTSEVIIEDWSEWDTTQETIKYTYSSGAEAYCNVTEDMERWFVDSVWFSKDTKSVRISCNMVNE